jgi:ABC-type phosphate transport system substrate-binding protein
VRPISFLHAAITLLMWGGCAISPGWAAEEPLAVIVPVNQAKLSIGKSELAAIYRRKKFYWEDGTKIQPVNLPAGSPARRIFSQAILGYAPEELEQYWNDRYFHGVLPPYVLTSEEAVLRFVSETPGAIGYVPYCDADKRVTIVLVISAKGHVSGSSTEISCAK